MHLYYFSFVISGITSKRDNEIGQNKGIVNETLDLRKLAARS